MSEKQSAISWDLDGVVFHRGTEVQWGGLKAYTKFWSYNKPFSPKHPNGIAFEDRAPVNKPMSSMEELNLFLHSVRPVRREVAKLIRDMHVDTMFVNTGRPNHVNMVTMTYKSLGEAGLLPYFDENLSFKPHGVESDESKYWRLREIEADGFTDITHYDDNARTQKRLAKALPHMRFVIVQDLTSGVLFNAREMRKYPNVARIALDRDGTRRITYMSPDFGTLPLTA